MWVEYTDRTGRHFAQFDILIKESDHVRIYEAKLTSRCRDAHIQVERYGALATCLWSLPVQLVHVYKWSGGTAAAGEGNPGVIGASPLALELRTGELVLDWHFLGA